MNASHITRLIRLLFPIGAAFMLVVMYMAGFGMFSPSTVASAAIQADNQAGDNGQLVFTSYFDPSPRADGLTDIYDGDHAWGDVDQDGYLDLLLTGRDGANAVTRLFYNTATGFTDSGEALPGLLRSSAQWADVDYDGYLDLALSRVSPDEDAANTKIFINDDEGLVESDQGELEGVESGDLAFADVNNDGAPDLLVTGFNGSTSITELYLNDWWGEFYWSQSLEGLHDSVAEFADYNNDGWVDLVIAGTTDAGSDQMLFYKNVAGELVPDVVASVAGLAHPDIEWADFNQDGCMDLLYAGEFISTPSMSIFTNHCTTTGIFTEQLLSVPSGQAVSVDAVDYDNDGDADILVSGNDTATTHGPLTRVYANNAGSFSVHSTLTGLYRGTAEFVDYDDDHDVDILLTGADSALVPHTLLVSNPTEGFNPSPEPPAVLTATVTGSQVTLRWTRSQDTDPDTEEPYSPNDLQYNVAVGSWPDEPDVLDPLAFR